MPEVNLIWAETKDGTIAKDGGIPWRQKADLVFFKEETIDQVIVMGRNTLASLNGRALPKRKNLVLTHDENLAMPDGFEKVYSPEAALAVAEEAGKKLQVIGGKPVYTSFMAVATALYVTYLDSDFHGDVLMDPVDRTVWTQADTIAEGPADADNDYAYRVVRYTR